MSEQKCVENKNNESIEDNLQIRIATIEDVDIIKNIALDAGLLEMIDISNETIERLFNQKQANFIAFFDRIPVGYIISAIFKLDPKEPFQEYALSHVNSDKKSRLTICSFAVRPAYQGLGIGSLLLEQLFAQYNPTTAIALHVRARSHVRYMYLKKGFIPLQQIANYYTYIEGHPNSCEKKVDKVKETEDGKERKDQQDKNSSKIAIDLDNRIAKLITRLKAIKFDHPYFNFDQPEGSDLDAFLMIRPGEKKH